MFRRFNNITVDFTFSKDLISLIEVVIIISFNQTYEMIRNKDNLSGSFYFVTHSLIFLSTVQLAGGS